MASAVIGAGTDPGPGGRKTGMRSPVTWLIVLGIALAGGAYLLYRRSQNSAASSSSTTGTTTPDQTDESGQIATLQQEIMDLQSSEAQEPSGSGTGIITSPTAPPGGAGNPPPVKPKVPAMPTSVKGTASGPQGLRLSWTRVAGATSYKVRVTYQGKLAGSATASGTTATIGGLGANHTYTAHVAACNSAGCSAETNGPVIHTPRAA